MMRTVAYSGLSIAIAFFVMLAFEFANSYLFPFPEGLDRMNLEAVRAFAQTLPASAYILVLLGWFFGSCAAGWALSRYLPTATVLHVLVIGGFLTLNGVLNNLMLLHPWWVNLFGLPLFVIGSYAGYVAAKKYEQR
ncbi:MAG: hypothetical protein KBE09_04890 [Candidatus Pacebacteria bacterium]|nr:hypothetical protein [Candidatus Paceibacterota bacterium]